MTIKNKYKYLVKMTSPYIKENVTRNVKFLIITRKKTKKTKEN